MIPLLGIATIALLCTGLLLIQSERREGSRVASEAIVGWEEVAIPLLLIATMASLCTAALLNLPRRTGATHAPMPANVAPAAIAPTAAIFAAIPSPTVTNLPAATRPPTPTAVPQSTPTAVSGARARSTVDQARARFDRLRALHFVLTTEGGVTLDPSGARNLTAAEGDLLRPDRVSLTATLSAGPVDTELRLIQIGDDAYLATMPAGTWGKAPAGFSYDAGLLFDKDRGVSAVLERGVGWQPVETATVNGVETRHVRGPVLAGLVNDLVGSSLRGEYVDVDLYIEPSNADIIKFIVSEPPSAVPAHTPPSRWTLDLSRQDEQIVIEAPPLGR